MSVSLYDSLEVYRLSFHLQKGRVRCGGGRQESCRLRGWLRFSAVLTVEEWPTVPTVEPVTWPSQVLNAAGDGVRRFSKQTSSQNAFQATKTCQLVGTWMLVCGGSQLMFRLEAGPDRPSTLRLETD